MVHPILQTLRQETSAQHVAIESVPLLQRISAEDFQLSEYVELLKRQYGFYEPYEQMLFSHPDVYEIPNIEERRRVPLIRQDLEYLGVPMESLEQIPRINQHLDTSLFDVPSLHQWAGIHYVVEGSTLGSQFISRHLCEHFNLQDGNGLAFYLGFGEETGKYWAEYRQFLQQVASSGNPEEESKRIGEMVDSAKRMFTLFHDWYSVKLPAQVA